MYGACLFMDLLEINIKCTKHITHMNARYVADGGNYKFKNKKHENIRIIYDIVPSIYHRTFSRTTQRLDSTTNHATKHSTCIHNATVSSG